MYLKYKLTQYFQVCLIIWMQWTYKVLAGTQHCSESIPFSLDSVGLTKRLIKEMTKKQSSCWASEDVIEGVPWGSCHGYLTDVQ